MFHPDSLPDLSGKVYIVTGGNSGIGYSTVARLVQHGAHVYLCARSPTRGNAAISSIQTKYPHAQITLLEMDHLSHSSVVAAAKIVMKKESAIHGLVNNAGIMATPFEMTKDGHEAQWQTNYLAHWVFTSHLLPLMLTTSKSLPPGSVRIVNLSSSGHWSAPNVGINFDDTSLVDSTGMARVYGPESPHAKAGEGEIWTAIVHPGLVESKLGDHAEMPRIMRALFNIYGDLGGRIDSDKGSWTSLFCVASPDMKREQSGTYFQRIVKPGWESSKAKDVHLAAKLEKWTEEEMKREGWVP